MNTLKLLNDPIYGFITIPNTFIFELIEHKYFQRLRRISQMGLSYLVYPGAHHTRFHHALGCLHIMQKAVQTLRIKNVVISKDEEQALYIAILLHDIGHGPFSHAMENSIVSNIAHEHISELFMQRLNDEFNGTLTLAIQLFKGTYHRKFLCQLISSQLDMDRIDYLKRDSFYTGVTEGNINSDRLIAMLNVVNNTLVVEKKGIYSVEKFLVARRLMYWQVYLHKTSLVAEQLLVRMLQRAKMLSKKGVSLQASQPLQYFLNQNINLKTFNNEALDTFSQLDDFDIIAAMKAWQHHPDTVLSYLCSMLINRNLLKIKMKKNAPSQTVLDKKREVFTKKLNVTAEEIENFVFTGKVSHYAYQNKKQPINIITKKNNLQDIIKASDQLYLKSLTKPVTKYYICYTKVKV